MLYFVFGFPGSFADWCAGLTAALTRCAGQPTGLLEADSLRDLALNAIRAGTLDAVVMSRQPGGRLRAALIESGRGFLLAVDDPRAALLDLVLGRGLDLRDAVRLLASSCSSLAGLSDAPGALVLEAGRDRSQPAVAAVAIVRHLQIPVAPDAVATAVEAVSGDGPSFRIDDAVDWWNGLDRAQREMAMGALAPFIDAGPLAAELPIVWTGELFSEPGRPDRRASDPIDITGRAHCIFDGPNIMLPAGAWSLTLTLFCSREAADYEFLVEVTADAALAAATLRPQSEGETAVTLDFAIGELAESPVVIRVSTVRAAFDGTISLLAARFFRATAAQGDASG